MSAEVLLSQVKNTVPFVWTDKLASSPYLKFLTACSPENFSERSGVEYFKLCVCAHFATVSSFVPTDVDNVIRVKLWQEEHDLDVLEQMARFILSACSWDPRPVSARTVESVCGERIYSSFSGEWLSVVVGCYWRLKKHSPGICSEIMDAIDSVMIQSAEFVSGLYESRCGIELLKASFLVAHNTGDLDRVIDLLDLSSHDPLRTRFYRLGHEHHDRYGGWLTLCGVLNQKLMAKENHRHYVLRKPRALRRRQRYLLPIGPFFDAWGNTIATDPEITQEELGEIIEALVDGWIRLESSPVTSGSVGYARALNGILDVVSGGINEIGRFLPVQTKRRLESGRLRSLLSIGRAQFERRWELIAFKPQDEMRTPKSVHRGGLSPAVSPVPP